MGVGNYNEEISAYFFILIDKGLFPVGVQGYL